MSFNPNIVDDIEPRQISSILMTLSSGRTIVSTGAEAEEFWQYIRELKTECELSRIKS